MNIWIHKKYNQVFCRPVTHAESIRETVRSVVKNRVFVHVIPKMNNRIKTERNEKSKDTECFRVHIPLSSCFVSMIHVLQTMKANFLINISICQLLGEYEVLPWFFHYLVFILECILASIFIIVKGIIFKKAYAARIHKRMEIDKRRKHTYFSL
jgi:hypothetical protein